MRPASIIIIMNIVNLKEKVDVSFISFFTFQKLHLPKYPQTDPCLSGYTNIGRAGHCAVQDRGCLRIERVPISGQISIQQFSFFILFNIFFFKNDTRCHILKNGFSCIYSYMLWNIYKTRSELFQGSINPVLQCKITVLY